MLKAFRQSEQQSTEVVAAFQCNASHASNIAPYVLMQEDVCSTAFDKCTSLVIIVPF